VQNATIGELARRTGIPIKTIRYYAEIGLYPRPGVPEPATGRTTRRPCSGWSWSAHSGSSA